MYLSMAQYGFLILILCLLGAFIIHKVEGRIPENTPILDFIGIVGFCLLLVSVFQWVWELLGQI